MDKIPANIYLAWLAGICLGVGSGTGSISLLVTGTILSIFMLIFYHRYVKPKDDTND